MDARLLVLMLGCCAAHTIVQFAPAEQQLAAGAPQVAKGFAYAFQTPGKETRKSRLLQEDALNNNQQTTTQYHSQDQLGQYAFGYIHNNASRHEERSLQGGTSGTYSFLDLRGERHSVSYVADGGGYRLESLNTLPSPTLPTEAVQRATLAHLATFQDERRKRLMAIDAIRKAIKIKRSASYVADGKRLESPLSLPAPTLPTEAVQRATLAHLATFRDERRRRLQAIDAIRKANKLLHENRRKL